MAPTAKQIHVAAFMIGASFVFAFLGAIAGVMRVECRIFRYGTHARPLPSLRFNWFGAGAFRGDPVTGQWRFIP
jgi:hypothetical protein